MIWIVPIVAGVLLASGLALAYVIGGAAVLTFVLSDNTRYLAVLPQKVFSQISVFSLLAMPLFILAGELMNRGGVTKSLIDLSMALIGRLRGGLGHVNIMTSVFFAGISGSAVADAAALSNTLVPAMRERGYTAEYAGAITAASSIIGPIVPPSIILIFYGALMQTSVAALFVAGIMPGLLLAAALFAVNGFFAWRDDHPRVEKGDAPNLFAAIFAALPALCLPIIIVGGIILGWMTPTEAAAVAVLAAVVAAFFYSPLTLADIWESFSRTAILTGSIFMILCAVAAFGHLAALERIPQAIAGLVDQIGLGPVGFLLVMNLIFILAGMVMDVPVALALLVPLLAPVALANGADPVHLGIVICFNLCIGLVSPPLGGCLLIVSTVTGVNYWKLARAVMPFVFAELIVLGILVFTPEISLWLPRTLGLWK
ncbi:TRAP transporter large permease [Sulfitobacter pseudonitzschiae]|uniref:TRAP transporter large permease protein n=1 Tax=Pseudosulfitobacter pseudonitzschiae TaxID=1402135 RepID=A0A9Q2NUT8_9RHOB|nr:MULTISPECIES: TRAP transporter large permease [Roseobacteraceae]MBM2293226.1 TRAP transporter large permease [Pseudosulfitobacter pseudonitzschiae]MBM2297913.1 TRAP transporter large permease [Pseudosulfitobacter pseudonitzschiae]MBM2302827.1 TRAP transporter large permease [Pseudosulfitobacter pseudonitzschiae]MBM2312507.1 TRAP transporter large permease [Pseudosulfitobacter pseudonitzschiae]MBM2317523.1 TRAP transporter large permease [Pseudosulfitobacter pseudonitzschiae]|tara:strand:- start:1605 stop:2888 length:1284 start_codon:yes stop_codon:yes gene_type:complete